MELNVSAVTSAGAREEAAREKRSPGRSSCAGSPRLAKASGQSRSSAERVQSRTLESFVGDDQVELLQCHFSRYRDLCLPLSCKYQVILDVFGTFSRLLRFMYWIFFDARKCAIFAVPEVKSSFFI